MLSISWRCLCLAPLSVVLGHVETRQVVNFDFAWRFKLDLPGGIASHSFLSLSRTPPEAAPNHDDSSWEVVDAPHDMLITGNYSQSSSKWQAFLPRGSGWYRKRFALPSTWRGSVVWLYLEGSFHETDMWLNGVKLGKKHMAGYTSFWYRLDFHNLWFDNSGASNVLAARVNAASGTGWWYEGGGLSRHYYLVSAPTLFMPPDTAWTWADMSRAQIQPNGVSPADGLRATGVTYNVEAVIQNAGKVAVDNVQLAVAFSDGGSIVSEPAITLAPQQSQTIKVRYEVGKAVQLWSIGRPHLITASLKILQADSEGDAQKITFGARSVDFDASSGFKLNGERVKLRGFCDHSSFGGVGAAVADRINLFRVQALRAVGGNAWRMAHNPPLPSRLDMMDRLGMVAIDENRDFGGHVGQGGTTAESNSQELLDMASMVQRDRSHPSIVIWSFCNEVGCKNESAAALFRAITIENDPTRPVTQNHLGEGTHPVSMYSLDVQGMSHKNGNDMDHFRRHNPNHPVMSTECCSCFSQRGVDVDVCPEPKDGGDYRCHNFMGQGGEAGVFYNNEIGQCTAEQVDWSDSRDFNAGTFVWSGFDYLGESRGWPQVTKCRGTVADVVGFEKESRWWLRSWWYSRISELDPGRPVLWHERDEPETTVRIVESWVPAPMRPTRTIHVYTSAPSVRLWVNGKMVREAKVNARADYGIATFRQVLFEPGNLTAEAVGDTSKSQLATHEVHTPLGLAKLRLSLDAPSPSTGTGSALLADGEDVAMVRAELLDTSGHIVSQGTDSSVEVTFTVVSGKGRLVAVHNGDPAEQSKPGAGTIRAHHGLARAFVRSSQDATSSAEQRRLMLLIDRDSGRGASCQVVDPDNSNEEEADPEPIIIEAQVRGVSLKERLSIPVTRDLQQHPLAIAARAFSAPSVYSGASFRVIREHSALLTAFQDN